MSDHLEIRQGREIKFVQIFRVLARQLFVEGLRAIRAAEIIVLAADAGTHRIRSGDIDTAHGILNHLIMPRTSAWERWPIEFPQSLLH